MPRFTHFLCVQFCYVKFSPRNPCNYLMSVACVNVIITSRDSVEARDTMVKYKYKQVGGELRAWRQGDLCNLPRPCGLCILFLNLFMFKGFWNCIQSKVLVFSWMSFSFSFLSTLVSRVDQISKKFLWIYSNRFIRFYYIRVNTKQNVIGIQADLWVIQFSSKLSQKETKIQQKWPLFWWHICFGQNCLPFLYF